MCAIGERPRAVGARDGALRRRTAAVRGLLCALHVRLPTQRARAANAVELVGWRRMPSTSGRVGRLPCWQTGTAADCTQHCSLPRTGTVVEEA